MTPDCCSGADGQFEYSSNGSSYQKLKSHDTLEDPPQPSDVALLLHTSGTTSRPKGVPLKHENLAAGIQNIIATYALSPDDRSLLVMPLFHIHGIVAGQHPLVLLLSVWIGHIPLEIAFACHATDF